MKTDEMNDDRCVGVQVVTEVDRGIETMYATVELEENVAVKTGLADDDALYVTINMPPERRLRVYLNGVLVRGQAEEVLPL